MSAILKQKLIDIANGFTKYGLWKGGGSSALSEMTDVTLTNLQANDVLKYNGSVWVNDDNLQKQIDTLSSNFIYKTINISEEGTINENSYVSVSIESIHGYIPISATIISGNWFNAFTISNPITNDFGVSNIRLMNITTSVVSYNHMEILVQYKKV